MQFKRWGRLLLLLIAALASSAAPASVFAHASLMKANPLQESVLDASPSAIRLSFSEEVDVDFSGIQLLDDSGSEIEGELESDGEGGLTYRIPALPDGVYTVRWQVLSQDSHPVDGSFRFSVNAPLPTGSSGETVSLDDEPPSPAPRPSESAASAPAPTPTPTPEPDSTSASAEPSEAPTPSATASPAETADTSASPVPSESAPTSTDLPSEETAAAPTPAADADDQPAIADAVDAAPAPAQPDDPAEDTVELHRHDHHDMHEDPMDQPLHNIIRIAEVMLGAVAAGFMIFRHWIWLPAGDRTTPTLLSDAFERKLYIAIAAGFVLTGVTHLGLLHEQLNVFGNAPSYPDLLFGHVIGAATWLRPILLFAVGVSVALPNRRLVLPLRAAAMVGVLLFFPLIGHAAGDYGAIVSHMAHFLGASAWFGGLGGILAYTWTRREHVRELAAMIRRFSVLALPFVLIVLLTGIVLTYLHVTDWEIFVTSLYGRLLLAKAALLVCIIAIGAVHRLAVIPTLGTGDGNGLAARRFVRIVRIEIVLAIALFALAGLLSTTPHP